MKTAFMNTQPGLAKQVIHVYDDTTNTSEDVTATFEELPKVVTGIGLDKLELHGSIAFNHKITQGIKEQEKVNNSSNQIEIIERGAF